AGGGVDHLFHGIFDSAAAVNTPTPQRESFDRFIKRHGVSPARAVMFEDSARNLETAAGIGFATVLVRAREDINNGHTAGPGEHPEFVDYAVDCLDTFLGEVVETFKETPA
ncbi:MAG: HAD-IA family hydrolase, partial [Oceanicaulis sp.]|nr:HAD-IA family hydrolase [Oceanicaulis sp.]